MKKFTFLLLLIIVAHHSSYAQSNVEVTLFGKKKSVQAGKVIRCASTEYEEYLKASNPQRLSTQEFEQWLAPKVQLEQARKRNSNKTAKTSAVITIPVVVHVIHNGDAVGSNENLFAEQIFSQIRVLNEDFRRKVSTPGFNTNPVGADTEIEFALAKRDPAGVFTNGINRVNLGKSSWSDEEIKNTLKPQTQWNPEKYLNIWVVNFTQTGVLGFAQFPTQSGLNGLNSDETDANTDGIVVQYQYFGSKSYFPSGTYGPIYDQGRTATHEVGHYLGLRHIWGDGNKSIDGCTVDDFCEDTPNAATDNAGCPTNVDSCINSPGLDMVENYMDYTDDICMNIFTGDQKTRMITVMNNSPRRASLKTSDALTPGVILNHDGAIAISNLNIQKCSNSFTPVIILENKGNAALTAATIRYSIDNTNLQTLNWTGNLDTNASVTLTLNTLTTSGGTHNFNATILNVNNTTDQNTANNSADQTFKIDKNIASTIVNFTLQNDRFGSETTWLLTNSAGTILYSGGPYTDIARAQPLPAPVKETFVLANNDCYTFTINDDAADGVCCDWGEGSYTLATPTNEVIVTGGAFLDTESTNFRIGTLGTNSIDTLQNTVIYPNPTTDILNVSFDTNSLDYPTSYNIINLLGQTIRTKTIDVKQELQINVANLAQGMYFLQLVKNGSSRQTIPFVKK
ncbi:M43 family zinc metalloprotease [Flavobacterium turcicum]|uniref:T9SS type A sorting domain-containing protein n=1 Tax=Flavobacterium turcicum TaxID=2764718 RepID=A0ABR7JBD3_9FLAO|nr:M43 family zinc metalloprotease [Flavobacterium turcicum]MBC5861801.1 T9SS type A sorting domain-containing protein [Flavobacterium turcicum]NHL00532.1 T9SS type A sorting domain-containing protein [Flavobacterium turcicum]